MGVERQTATVWYAPTARRRYLSKANAIRGEAKAIIFAKHPPDPPDWENGMCTFEGSRINIDEPDRYEKMHRRLVRLIKAAS